jgi:stearoyl-CoA desaturase (delta-9 desaturase)
VPKTTGAVPTGLLWLFLAGPVVALVVAVTLAAAVGVGPSWLDLGLFVASFAITGHGITVGFHRYFTHRAFRANRPLRIALAIAGSMAVEGSVISWVATHRQHHAHSDTVGDPHSPWRYGANARALAKGMLWAHVGWLFDDKEANRQRFAPDLLADPDIRRVSKLFPLWIALTLILPAAAGGLMGSSWAAALTGFLWAGVVRMLVLHHVTWSVNSICHVVGKHPFTSP